MSEGRPVALGAAATAAAAAVLVAAVGGTLTRIGPWYRALKKPDWTPPDLAFPVVWTAIFALAAVAGLEGWRKASAPAGREWVIGLFALNGFLNVTWSLLFFALRRPDLAVFEAGVLWASVLAIILLLWRSARLGSLLMLPYLVWVGVAFFLNLTVVRLNGPFH